MAKKTAKNKKGAGRKPLFKDYPTKRIMISIPKFKDKEMHKIVLSELNKAVRGVLKIYYYH